MKYGFVKVRACAPDLRVADTYYNAEEIVRALECAHCDGVEVLLLPALSLCGSTCGDLFFQETLIDGCLKGLNQIIAASAGKAPLAFVGVPLRVGGGLFSCAVAVQNGRALGVVPQVNGVNRRYFASDAGGVNTVRIGDKLLPFGEDLLFSDERSPLKICCTVGEPSEKLSAAGANLILHLASEKELVGSREKRLLLARAYATEHACGYLYSNAGAGESTADAVYAGHQFLVEGGKLVAECLPFSGGILDCEFDAEGCENERSRRNFVAKSGEKAYFTTAEGEFTLTRKIAQTPFIPTDESERNARCELILTMQATGLAKRLERAHAKTALLGVSGGLDSTLAFLVVSRAFELLKRDKKGILAYTMPGFGTTARTKNNSLRLMELMGATAKTMDITPSVRRHFTDIEQDENSFDVTYENAQARMRTLILMDVANKTGGLVVGTGDLSELALGWCTYNGDHMSMYAVNADLPKTLIRSLVAYEGARLGGEVKTVVESVLGTDVSPELLPPDKAGEIAQKTEDLVGPYELHDFYLYYAVRRGYSPKKIAFLAETAFAGKYARETLVKWLKNFYARFFTQQFKRSCMPEGVQVGSVCLSPRGEWQMPSDACVNLWRNEVEAL